MTSNLLILSALCGIPIHESLNILLIEGKIPNPNEPPLAATAAAKYISIRDKIGGKRIYDTEKHSGDRRLTWDIKDKDNLDAIRQAGERMSKLVPKKSRLIPIPSRTGDTEANLRLAREIASRTGAEVHDILTRSRPSESSREAKKRGSTMAIDQHNMAIRSSLPADPKHEYNNFFVDNTVSTGSSLAAARRALGGIGHGLVYSAGERRKLKLIRDKPGWETQNRRAPVDKDLNAKYYSNSIGHGFYEFNDGTRVYHGSGYDSKQHVIYDKHNNFRGQVKIGSRDEHPDGYDDHLRLIQRHRRVGNSRTRGVSQVQDVNLDFDRGKKWRDVALHHQILSS